MTTEATFTKRVGRSRQNFVIWIPKDVTALLRLREGTILQVTIRTVGGPS